jgi:hypothetical protein
MCHYSDWRSDDLCQPLSLLLDFFECTHDLLSVSFLSECDLRWEVAVEEKTVVCNSFAGPSTAASPRVSFFYRVCTKSVLSCVNSLSAPAFSYPLTTIHRRSVSRLLAANGSARRDYPRCATCHTTCLNTISHFPTSDVDSENVSLNHDTVDHSSARAHYLDVG